MGEIPDRAARRCRRKNTDSRRTHRFSKPKGTRCVTEFCAIRRLDDLFRQFAVSSFWKAALWRLLPSCGYRKSPARHFALPSPVRSPRLRQRSPCARGLVGQAPRAAKFLFYGEPEEPVVVTWRLEKGRILWWAAPTPLTNSGIVEDGNLPFFLGCIQAVRPGSTPGNTTVLWDEYFHGYRGSPWDYFRRLPCPGPFFN